jgi:hypothetical protein
VPSQASMKEIVSTPLVFLFGFERSGTTLLSMMIGAHPRIAVPFSVTGLWYRYATMLPKYNNLHSLGDVEHLVDDLLNEQRIRLWDVELKRGDVLAKLRPGYFPAVVTRFHELYAQQKGKDLWGNIDIATLEDMDVANSWFPETKFVHIVRDGRDVALSHETYVYGASTMGECAEKWVNSLRLNLKMGAIIGPKRYLLIRYEDLVLETEKTLRRVCDFLGVAYAPQMLEYPRMVSTKIPEDRRFLWPLLDKPPTKSKVNRWKTEMGEIQRIVFERTANTMLRDLGYETYATVPRRLRANALELWYFLGEGGRFKRAAAKLGLQRWRQPLMRNIPQNEKLQPDQRQPPGAAT